jgi:hypothetical protein
MAEILKGLAFIKFYFSLQKTSLSDSAGKRQTVRVANSAFVANLRISNAFVIANRYFENLTDRFLY